MPRCEARLNGGLQKTRSSAQICEKTEESRELEEHSEMIKVLDVKNVLLHERSSWWQPVND